MRPVLASVAPLEDAAPAGSAAIGTEGAARSVDLDFEPEIIVFACHYCAYAAADLAGVMRLDYPSNIRIIKLPCTGKLEVIHLLRAIEAGADGVYAAGCMEGECHFLKGNIWARKRVEHVKKLLTELGIEPERVEMYNMSSAMGARFAEVATEFTERIRALGPNPVKRQGMSPHAAAREALGDIALPDDEGAASGPRGDGCDAPASTSPGLAAPLRQST
jgi:coenzyme F420-reducing hydrogenase delta subunit